MTCELAASRCPACGLLAVPPEPFGCERCGSPGPDLRPEMISSAGAVVAAAVVHEHARPEPPTPFVVVEVRLDDGPVVRSLLRHAAPGDVHVGDRVAGDMEAERFAFVLAEAVS